MMKRIVALVLMICLFDVLGCAHRFQGSSRDNFLKTKMSPTGAYEIQYVDREALVKSVRAHGIEPVLFALEQEFCDNWGHLDHFRLTGAYEAEILDAMESIKTGTGRKLLEQLTGEAMREQQQAFREIWMKSHNQASDATSEPAPGAASSSHQR